MTDNWTQRALDKGGHLADDVGGVILFNLLDLSFSNDRVVDKETGEKFEVTVLQHGDQKKLMEILVEEDEALD